MTDDELEIARFFVALVNLSDTGGLSSVEHRRLAGQLLRIPGARAALRAEAHRTGRQDRDVACSYLDTVHHHIRELLPRLVDGQPVTPPKTLERSATWRVVDGVLEEHGPASDHALGYFAQLCRQKRFPFARCPECGTIYVRVRRQRFCTSACADRAFAITHKAERREYMKEYMASRRAKTRNTQRKGR